MCEYFPPGNVVGDNNQYFKDNVPKQAKGNPADTVESGVTATSGAQTLRDEIWSIGVLAGAVLVGVGLLA